MIARALAGEREAFRAMHDSMANVN
jgi:hypothetical protein